MPSGPRLGQTSLYGYVDGIRNGLLCGWAWNAQHPRRRVRIRVSRDGSVVQHVVARRFRADVEAAGFGDGCCGFELPISALATDGESVSLVVETADEGLELVGSPSRLNTATATLEQLVQRYEMWKLELFREVS